MDFKVVQIWYNDIWEPYTLKPKLRDSTKQYAILVDGHYFLLGGENEAIYICDKKVNDNG